MAGVPPGRPLVPELDFSSQPYGNLSKRFVEDIAYARSIIEEKLPVLSELNALLSVTLGNNLTLFIDARAPDSPAKLLESHPDDGAEPDCQLALRPETIIQFYQGHLDPRYGLFKDDFLHDTAMSKKSIPLAIKFSDLLTPQGPPALPKPTSAFERLPVPTEDIAQVKRDIKEFGYGLVKNALTPTQIAVLRKAVEEQAAGERKAGVARMDGGADATSGPNQRLWVLVNKGDEFLDLLNHPLIDEIVPWLIGDHALLHSYLANIARPGNIPMVMHTDQVAVQPPIRDVVFGVNIMFALTDVTASNGATRIIPGSHLGHVAPADIFSIEGTIPAEAPAGSAFVFDSRLWHGTGPNTLPPGSPDSERPTIFMFFMRSFIRSQENYSLSLRPDVARKLSQRQRKFLGFCATGTVGGQEGYITEGTYFDRKEDCVGAIRAPHEPYMPGSVNGA